MSRSVTVRALVVLVSCLTLSYLSCDWPVFFQRSPALAVIWSSNDSSAFRPVWSPDGEFIYFLVAHPRAVWYYEDMGGELWRMHADGSGATKLLEGSFGALNISHDGSRLLLRTGEVWQGGSLLIVDTMLAHLDTVSSLPPNISDAVFGTGDTTVICFLRDQGFIRVNLATSRLDTLLELREGRALRFDAARDSLLVYPGHAYDIYRRSLDSVQIGREPRIDPQMLTRVISTAHEPFCESLLETNLATDSSQFRDVAPYWASDIRDPCWSPDGRFVVYSASRRTRGDPKSRPEHYELWVVSH